MSAIETYLFYLLTFSLLVAMGVIYGFGIGYRKGHKDGWSYRSSAMATAHKKKR